MIKLLYRPIIKLLRRPIIKLLYRPIIKLRKEEPLAIAIRRRSRSGPLLKLGRITRLLIYRLRATS